MKEVKEQERREAVVKQVGREELHKFELLCKFETVTTKDQCLKEFQ